MADPRLRELGIKTRVVKRLAKEKSSYEKEAEQQRARVEKLKVENNDEHMIKKQEEVLQECLMMIPNCHRRLVKAFSELEELVKSEDDIKDTQEFGTALAVIEETKAQMSA